MVTCNNYITCRTSIRIPVNDRPSQSFGRNISNL